MWRGRSVSVVLPTYNERDSIAGVIHGFEGLGVVDEIVVVNNNAAPGTSEEVARTSAREVVETTQGYGAAIRRGLREATGDLICVCEPDGTFDPDDLFKLLTYTGESDFVVGSRTVSTFIWTGANMDWFLQFGNWVVAKMIEASFNTTSLSDVGCTFRIVTQDLARQLETEFRHTGSAFGLEMLLLATRRQVRVVQIPVNYLPRVGESSVTGDFRKTVRLGATMVGMVAKARASRVAPLPLQYRRPAKPAKEHGRGLAERAPVGHAVLVGGQQALRLGLSEGRRAGVAVRDHRVEPRGQGQPDLRVERADRALAARRIHLGAEVDHGPLLDAGEDVPEAFGEVDGTAVDRVEPDLVPLAEGRRADPDVDDVVHEDPTGGGHVLRL